MSRQDSGRLTNRGRRLHVLKEFFWAVLEKLSPARRVLLLVALIMLMGPGITSTTKTPLAVFMASSLTPILGWVASVSSSDA